MDSTYSPFLSQLVSDELRKVTFVSKRNHETLDTAMCLRELRIGAAHSVSKEVEPSGRDPNQAQRREVEKRRSAEAAEQIAMCARIV